MKRTDTNTCKFAHTPVRRSRPLTRVQEVLFISTAFVLGGLLQMLVILHIGVS